MVVLRPIQYTTYADCYALCLGDVNQHQSQPQQQVFGMQLQAHQQPHMIPLCAQQQPRQPSIPGMHSVLGRVKFSMCLRACPHVHVIGLCS